MEEDASLSVASANVVSPDPWTSASRQKAGHVTTQPVHDRTDRTPTWTVQGVFDPDVKGQNFSYTIGLHDRGLPELHLWASPTDGDDPGEDWAFSHHDRCQILNELAFAVIDGRAGSGLNSRGEVRQWTRDRHLRNPASGRSRRPRGTGDCSGRSGAAGDMVIGAPPGRAAVAAFRRCQHHGVPGVRRPVALAAEPQGRTRWVGAVAPELQPGATVRPAHALGAGSSRAAVVDAGSRRMGRRPSQFSAPAHA